jgi:glutamate racemase
MKIGIFDSGLGGLIIAKSIFKLLPKYDYIYFGDTKNLPYGEKSKTQIYQHTKKAVDFLFKQDCNLVILACNTASAMALRKIQQDYLKKYYPSRRVLGVIIPTLEAVDSKLANKNIGVIATNATANSHIYINPKAKIYELATPKLTSLIENNLFTDANKYLIKNLNILKKKEISTLILGCTHYALLKKEAKKFFGKNVVVLSQDNIIPQSLAKYLTKHKEIEVNLSTQGFRKFYTTSERKSFSHVAKRLFGKNLKFEIAKI